MFRRFILLALLLTVFLPARPASAQKAEFSVRELESIERYELPAVDMQRIRLDDERRAASGRVPHYAAPLETRVTPWDDHGNWTLLAGGVARWQLRLASPGPLSPSLALSRYRMPAGGSLLLFSADGRHRAGPFSERDNEDHGQLWTPPIATDELVLEILLPVDQLDDLELELARAYHGYAGFGETGAKSGDCHRDVACVESWVDQARSVALVSVGGVRYCTGFLVNNTSLDGTPYFITASHCGITEHNAPSVVVFWNHERGGCGEQAPAKGESQFQTGAILRASHPSSDTVLLELDDRPDAAFGVYYAGWDRSLVDPARTIVIHHPNTDVKRISFDFDRAMTTSHLGHEPNAGGDHIRIGEWDLGSTEGGSSGAPLFNRDKRVVGQLHGGWAACGDAQPDWFGRFSSAWTGRGRAGFRLSDWLDPLDTGAVTLDGIDGVEVGDGQ